jgi:hypothetical protein
MRQKCSYTAIVAMIVTASAASADQPIIDPVHRAVKQQEVRTWEFQQGVQGWVAENQCTLSVANGSLRIESSGNDPYFHSRLDGPGGQTVVELRVRCRAGGRGSVFWTSTQQPHRGEDKRADFPLPDDGQWMVTRARFTAAGRLRDLRIDPGTAPGLIEIDWIRLIHEQLHPLTISQVAQQDGVVNCQVTNHADRSVDFTLNGTDYSLRGGQSRFISQSPTSAGPLTPICLTLRTDDWPPVQRTVWVIDAEAEDTNWLRRSFAGGTLSVARDGSVALVHQQEQLIASLGPLVIIDNELPEVRLVDDSDSISFRGAGVSVALSVKSNEIDVTIESDQPCEGPVVRAHGELEQGLFAGLEYLGRRERSSSNLDIETPEHIRFAPDPLKVTMPLMAFVTNRASIALTWDDMSLQPVYATPNFFDGTADHRMSLRGKTVHVTLRVANDPLEESIAWMVRKQGLPELPTAPRTKQQQRELCLAGLSGPLKNEQGWGHCVQQRWKRQPFSDMASTLWRLGGQIPDYKRYAFGGAHVPNGTIYFVSGRAERWLDIQRQRIAGFLGRQQPDGSYRYQGKYARGHFEDTASGVCALPAARMLEFAYQTGDQQALQAGIRTLNYMKRFRTPRGAQVWEVPLHTPDQLASAYLVWAYTRGYELTGNEEYRRLARKWALSGLPFTYLWSRYPIMAYSTPPVYGATNWVAPNWMGLPVQWVGGVYAYALTRLAPHDESVDWNHVARGILISAQQQQYPEGTSLGLLPDSFNLPNQRRQPADINPCALVSLQMALDGEVDFLSVARKENVVVAAPFPVTVRGTTAEIDAPPGVAYQVLVNGEVVDVPAARNRAVKIRIQ